MENADVYDDFDYNLEANLELFLEALLAFGNNPYAGKNSRVARSLRARAQRRDRYGRFAKMGPMGFDYFDATGNQQTARGFYIGPANEEGFLQIYIENDPILGTGIFNVKENNASQYIANLTPEQLKRAGIEVGKDVTGKPISARDRKIIPSIAQLNRQDAPDGWVKNDDGSYTSEDGAYQIVPPTGKGKNWTLYPIKKGKREKGTTHRNMSEAIKKANDLDTESLLTPADQKKLEDLQGDLVATQETETDGDPIAEDAKQEEIATIEDKIENLLQEGKINENPVEEPVDGEEDQAPAQGTKTKKEGTTKLSGDVRNPGDETRKRKWAEMSEFSRKARVVVQEYMKKRNAGTATEKDLNDALRQLDGLHGPANLQGAKGFDADVDSLHGLFTELLEIPRTFAFYRNKNKGKPNETQLNDELKTKIAARQKELSSQVVALMTAIETRGKDNAKYANTPTVDTSTEHEDIATFEAPKYSGGPAKPGRPAGTGKNQIAAKKAEE